MVFIRAKHVNGRTYFSEEARVREGGKVKSIYIRALGSALGRMSVKELRGMSSDALARRIEGIAWLTMMRLWDEQQAKYGAPNEILREEEAKAKTAAFEKEHGVKLPDDPTNVTPVEKLAAQHPS